MHTSILVLFLKKKSGYDVKSGYLYACKHVLLSLAPKHPAIVCHFYTDWVTLAGEDKRHWVSDLVDLLHLSVEFGVFIISQVMENKSEKNMFKAALK